MKLKYILLIILLFGINFQNTFSNYKEFKNVNSFDWLLGIDNYSNINTNVKVIDIDVLDADKKIVDRLHKKGQIVIGYLNIGSIETYRADFDDFNKEIVGKIYPGWEDERFLDISKYELFKDNILNRLDIAKQKGFDGIEPDNMDTYDNYEETGFNISKQDEINYIKWFSSEVHKRGMFVIQKNAPELSTELVDIMDGALLEGAFYNDYEDKFQNYINKGKIVLNTEYTDNTNKNKFSNTICEKSKKLGYVSILKNRDLDKFVLVCNSNEYVISNSDKKLINLFIKKVLLISKKRNINLEVLISKIETNIGKKKLTKRIKKILNEIILGLKNNICNNYYNIHENIMSSVFWVGEKSDSSNAYISNMSSAWDEDWLNHSKSENKFYFALPYNDLDDNGNRKINAKKIPWYKLKKWGNNESIIKNRWIKIMVNNKIAYAQWEDVGPLHEDDFDYVFGNKKSKNTFGLKAGIDLSPDLANYLNIDGEGEVNWNFVPEYCVDNTIFKEKITKSNLNWK